MKAFTNTLVNETSPYLLQHAHNPVNWYPWGEEALQKAKDEDKPILVSIGYSACHWCHVMERESFENETTAALMNEHFVNIKVDREERPDIDHIYMDAVQAMSGRGGWPLNVFLTPDAKPFFGGTYFPPRPAHGLMSWNQLLEAVNKTFLEKRDDVEAQAQNLLNHLVQSNVFATLGSNAEENVFTKENAELIKDNLLQQADKEWGGFGAAPKFPQTFSIYYLLCHYYFTGSEEALQHALLSLDKMIQGGLYDQLGGGFARYSTDREWLVPHFEKMLYDNALLLGVISEAYKITRDDFYKDAIFETVAFLQRELQSPEGGFYSALDADSEGVEGKFYTWGMDEVKTILGEEAALFCRVYDITEEGNWEHANILWLKERVEVFAKANNLDPNALKEKLALQKQQLFEVRKQRIRPGLDDKILLGWNALMITALCKASAALSDEKILQLAESNIRFLESHLMQEKKWFHSYKKTANSQLAFLDDLAYLIQAYIHLQRVTGNNSYLIKAKDIAEMVMRDYEDKESGMFYFTSQEQHDVIVRKKEVYDGATPSGNAVMMENLFYLATVFDNSSWRARVEQVLGSFVSAITKYPSSFGVWAALFQNITFGINEICFVGDNAVSYLQEFNRRFNPANVVQVSEVEDDQFPLLKDKKKQPGSTLAYLCKNYTCKQPVDSVEELLTAIKLELND